MGERLKAVSKLGPDGRWIINEYECADCRDAGIQHEVKNVPGPPTTRTSTWGAGIPTTYRECSGCGRKDGPWVSAGIVGGGW